MTTTQAEKKADKAIDAMVDLQDGGYGSWTVQRILDMLRELKVEIESRRTF